ncbi:hypothetical protein WAI453_003350 [Rhynchosporium graminicola]
MDSSSVQRLTGGKSQAYKSTQLSPRQRHPQKTHDELLQPRVVENIRVQRHTAQLPCGDLGKHVALCLDREVPDGKGYMGKVEVSPSYLEINYWFRTFGCCEKTQWHMNNSPEYILFYVICHLENNTTKYWRRLMCLEEGYRRSNSRRSANNEFEKQPWLS